MAGAIPNQPQSWRVSSLYLFNIIVGTGENVSGGFDVGSWALMYDASLFAGVLSLPNIFAQAGLLLGTIFLLITTALSYITTSWLVESLAVISVLQQFHVDGVSGSKCFPFQVWL